MHANQTIFFAKKKDFGSLKGQKQSTIQKIKTDMTIK